MVDSDLSAKNYFLDLPPFLPARRINAWVVVLPQFVVPNMVSGSLMSFVPTSFKFQGFSVQGPQFDGVAVFCHLLQSLHLSRYEK